MKKSVKIILIVASIMLLVGIAVIAVSVSFYGLGREVKETISDSFDNITRIDINAETDNVAIFGDESLSDGVKVSYNNSDSVYYKITETDGVLNITKIDTRPWYKRIDLFWENDDTGEFLTIRLPAKSDVPDVNVKSTTGDLIVGSINDSSFNLNVDITTGDVKLVNIICESIFLKLTTGDVELEDTVCDLLKASTTTGDIEGNSLNIKKAEAETTTGGITIENINSESIDLKATTGDVECKINGKRDDYDVSCSTITGSCNVQTDDQYDRPKTISVRTKTGDIDISFSNEETT